MENEFVFILGNARELAAYELKSVLGQHRTATFNVSENLAVINSTLQEEVAAALINILGGTIKIGALVAKGNPADIILNDLETNPARDIGFSFYRGKIVRDHLFKIKNDLKGNGVKIRLVLPRQGNVLNAAEIRSNKLIGKGREYLICGDKVFRTIAVQDVNEISERDFGKPYANAFSGMLPPKLARMMVNVAANRNQISEIKDQKLTVVDPFCGSGNILIEALDLGYQVKGSDISDKAVKWTESNLSWFLNHKIKSKVEDNNYYSVVKQDATKTDILRGIVSPYVIVTEPFLGKPKTAEVSAREADRELEQLGKLYIGFLENLAKTSVRAKTIICLVFPIFELESGTDNRLYNRIVDRIGALGYIKLAGPFIYGRDYQVVKREVLLFNLKAKK